ncbi:MAG: Lrp/AsnC family transcriptional regulator [Candidatus Bathyarchaeota archaeon]|nr:Lrp/AsnC family transcriptional regulator [Candidatus Bathyarchaeum sp.]
MDDIDFKIAKIFCKNSRIQFKKVAEQIGVSTQTVIRRYAKLKKTLFTYSSITVDLEKLGFQATVGLFINVSGSKKGTASNIHDKIKKFPNVIVTFELLGPNAVSLLVAIRTFEELFTLLENVSNIEGVEEIELTVHKPHNVWPRQLYAKILEKF